MTLGSHLRLTPALFCGDPPFFHAPGLMHRPLQGGGFFLMHAGSWQKEKGGRSRPKSLEIKTPPLYGVGHLQKPPGALLGIMIPWT